MGTHRGAHAEPRHRRTNQPRQRDRVMVKLLSQPDLPDTDGRRHGAPAR